MAVLLPLLRALNSLIKKCQERDTYIGHLAQAIQDAEAKITRLYLATETAFNVTDFPELHAIVDPKPSSTTTTINFEWQPFEGTSAGVEDGQRVLAVALGEDSVFVTMKPPPDAAPAAGRRGRAADRAPVLVTEQRAKGLLGSAMQIGEDAAGMLQQQISVRLPTVGCLQAAMPFFPEEWAAGKASKLLAKDVLVAVSHFTDRYGKERVVTDSDGLTRTIPPLINAAKLKAQQQQFKDIMSSAAPLHMARHRDQMAAWRRECDKAQEEGVPLPPQPAPAVSQFWTEIKENQMDASISQWVELATMVLVMVGVTVEDERLFSTLAWVKNERRNRLEEEHLNVCLRLFHSKEAYSMAEFPYRAAFDTWSDVCDRRGVMD
jgi:hypothetical protein